MRGATRGLPRRSPILVLLSPNSDGIRCISAGMIAPVSTCTMKCYNSEGRGGEAARRRIFTGVSGGRFPCSSYGIATSDRRISRISRFHPGGEAARRRIFTGVSGGRFPLVAMESLLGPPDL
ncbi:hypothetical protein IMY05_019G0069000 [Salix suchowensis]|nr:hypothetical protein IMY05_019G0069000 [Salix suchowensis]